MGSLSCLQSLFHRMTTFETPGPDVIKDVSCSVEHETLKAHKYKNKNLASLVSDKLRKPFFSLINVKMPTFVGVLTFMSRKNFMLS